MTAGADEQRLLPLTLIAQVGMSLLLAVVLGVWAGPTVGVSALLGGVAAFAPNAFLAARLMNASADTLMRAAWIGEIGKLLLAALLFGLIFAYVRPISVLAVFGGFIGTHFAMLPAMLLLQRGGNDRTSTS
ncbi:MAG: ATP synthase subunit I [Gammaproteobacteria bacterium]|jgi:ATP synthase protein I